MLEFWSVGNVDEDPAEEVLFANRELAEEASREIINTERSDAEEGQPELAAGDIEYREDGNGPDRFGAYTADGEEDGYQYIRRVKVYESVAEFRQDYAVVIVPNAFEEGEYQV